VQLPALICSKCQIDLKSAANFRKISLIADTYFRNQSANHEKLIFIKDELSSDAGVEQYTVVEEIGEFIDQEVEIEALEEYEDEIIKYEFYDEKNIIYEEHLVDHDQQSVERKAVDSRKYTRQCHCGKKFPSQTRLDNHIKVQHTKMSEDEKLICLTCGKRFKVQEYLEAHIRSVTVIFSQNNVNFGTASTILVTIILLIVNYSAVNTILVIIIF
jgi:Zinc finger, C2H2 type